MRDRAATHQIRYRPTTSKSGRGSREFRAHSSQKKAYYSQILYTCRVYRSAHFSYLTASIEQELTKLLKIEIVDFPEAVLPKDARILGVSALKPRGHI